MPYAPEPPQSERPRTGGELCELLAWDSDFFGARVARLLADTLDEAAVSGALEWCRKRGVDCLYFLADPADAATIRVVENNGFRDVDTRVVFGRGLPGDDCQAGPNPDVRLFEPADLPALKLLARKSHKDSRFYADGRFSAARCDDLYETWIEKSCCGDASAVFVAERNGRAVGYLTCHEELGQRGRIGLVAVSSDSQSLGLGGQMVRKALCYFAARGIAWIRVATQRRNEKAMAFYKRHGFSIESERRWYHHWLRATP